MSTAETALRLTGVTKKFGGITVLRSIDLTVRSGEVLGLLGENGAGKSTLIKVLNGVHSLDSGSISLGGEEVNFSSPLQAIEHGIATVHQESGLTPSLDVAGDLLLGQERQLARSRLWLNRRAIRARAQEMVDQAGFPLDVRQSAADLSVGSRQMVSIARALALAKTVLVLDEPTAALSQTETDHLFEGIRRATERGLAVIFVTHRLREVPVVCDRVVVLRDGTVAGEVPADQADEQTLVSMMLGRKITTMFPERDVTPGEVVLAVEGLEARGLHHLALTVRSGEVLGVTGLLGGGQRELARSIYGAQPRRRGVVSIGDRTVIRNSPASAIAAGAAYISGDRLTDGVMPNLTLERTLTLPALRSLRPGSIVPRRKLRALASSLRDGFKIKSESIDVELTTLSGGNQQKALTARWIAREPRLLILDEPTLGVDVGSKSEIYNLINNLALAGTAVLLVSSESQELLGLSDRVTVMRSGHVVAELSRSEATEERVLRHSLGLGENAPLGVQR